MPDPTHGARRGAWRDAGDLLSMTLKAGYAASSMLLVGIFCITLGAQLRSKAYHPPLYWAVTAPLPAIGASVAALRAY